MKTKLFSTVHLSAVALLCCFNLVLVPAYAQQESYSQDGLFAGDDVLNIELSGKLNDLLKDRGNDVHYHFMTLSYTSHDSLISIPIKARTRGHFRKSRANCAYPPLLLNFSKEKTPKNSLFG